MASLELLASLLCILAFQPKQATTSGARISVTASGDNQSTGFILDKFSSSKYPMYLVLMELREQMRLRNMIFSIAWRPRDENEEADALTNEVFTGFDPGLRVPLQWEKALQELKADARKVCLGEHGASLQKKRGRLRETDPW